MSELHILNVGRADCAVFLLDTPEGTRTVVVDGGEKFHEGRRPLLDFLTQRRIFSIDLLILTHLHQDHFGGFFHLIDQVDVQHAVAPTGDLQFANCVYPVFGNKEYYREYHQFFEYLERNGTELMHSFDCVGKIFSFGEFQLECLYPLAGSPMRSIYYAQALCNPELTDEAMNYVLNIYKQICNEDSSIWLLRKNGKDLILLAGDSTDESMRAALCGREIHPWLQKLSHHGINSRYFSTYVQELLSPQILVVNVSSGIAKLIKRVTVAAQEIAAGKFDVTLSVKSKDEVGQLAQAFNQTLKRLIKSI